MWTAYLLLATILLGASSSPYMAIFFLVGGALSLSLKVGVSHLSWFLLTLIIVYLGGMMVMFVYLSSIMQTTKVNVLGTRVLVISLVLLSLSWSGGVVVNGYASSDVWLDMSFFNSNSSALTFLVGYLLVALLSVYQICEKQEGPMKSN